MTSSPLSERDRRDVYPQPLVDGREVRNGAIGGVRRRLTGVFTSRRDRDEAELERRLRTQPGVTRPNTVALISPKGGVGKTTCTFVVGNLLAAHLKLRVVAVDANPDFGTLASLVPDALRSDRSLEEVLEEADTLRTAAELRAYVSRLPTGLHVLGAPGDAELASGLGPAEYGELLAFLSIYYDVVLLDLGTGVAGPLAAFAVDRADQAVLVTTPEWVTSTAVLGALSHLQHDRTTVAINQYRGRSSDVGAVEARFRAEHLHRSVTIPFDQQLATMLDSGTYSLEALHRPTRMALRRVGLAVAEQLV